ncbi:isochorismatase family protein [Pseudomonas sp. NPDC008258]|uniref:hydrolase n=1 Tax=Pseudomonas sp. NPDC008258 TaxID=3364418 RepID=UPI0036EFA80C
MSGALIDASQATLLVVDVQEKLIGAMHEAERLTARIEWLVAACTRLALPVVFSEQYPKGLGPTLSRLKEACASAPVVEKLHFSCVPADCLSQSLMQRGQVVLCGIESHVCVLQTALDLVASGKQVFVVADATSSRTAENHLAALQRMAALGVQVVTREMVVFELLRTASHEQFREISKAFLAGEQP